MFKSIGNLENSQGSARKKEKKTSIARQRKKPPPPEIPLTQKEISRRERKHRGKTKGGQLGRGRCKCMEGFNLINPYGKKKSGGKKGGGYRRRIKRRLKPNFCKAKTVQ